MSSVSTSALDRSSILSPPKAPAESVGQLIRIALAVAMLTTWFEYGKNVHNGEYGSEGVVALVVMAVSMALTLVERFSRLGVILYALSFLPFFVLNWHSMANHTWLSYWCIPAAALFARWWEEEAYADYLRYTLGVVMLAAAAQKVLAGTYFDGSFIAFLSYYGSVTETMFRGLCSEATLQEPCLAHKLIGSFIVIWQIGVGVLLIAGLRSIIFLVVEIAFLLGAGIYADEMNFQVLNIALLCIAFRTGVTIPFVGVLLAVLFVDLVKIEGIYEYLS